MELSGWWVSGGTESVTVTATVFDETELSEASGWTQSHQNVDNDLPHGYVDLDAVCVDVKARLAPSLRVPEIPQGNRCLP